MYTVEIGRLQLIQHKDIIFLKLLANAGFELSSLAYMYIVIVFKYSIWL